MVKKSKFKMGDLVVQEYPEFNDIEKRIRVCKISVQSSYDWDSNSNYR